MRPTSFTLLLCSSSAFAAINLRATTFERLAGLQKRQIPTCFGFAPEGVPNPCEYVCGEGSRTCVEEGQCFNPTQGETCCSDGTYCPSGSYCSNAGCCPDDLSLEECGATATLATLPGGGAPTPSSSASSPSTTTETTETTTASFTPVLPTSAPSSSSSSSSPAPTPISPTNAASNGSTLPSPTSTPTQYTGAASRANVVGWTMGGMVLWWGLEEMLL